jgi:hypothetical protein
VRSTLILRLLFAAIGLGGLALVAGGVDQIHRKESGALVKATVASCQICAGEVVR